MEVVVRRIIQKHPSAQSFRILLLSVITDEKKKLLCFFKTVKQNQHFSSEEEL